MPPTSCRGWVAEVNPHFAVRFRQRVSGEVSIDRVLELVGDNVRRGVLYIDHKHPGMEGRRYHTHISLNNRRYVVVLEKTSRCYLLITIFPTEDS